MSSDKPYLVIARKYRPQTFEEVVGQDPVSRTLKNAIAAGRIGHAYLFTGPRGVGKTSMARIFAKALNCKEGPTADPCGKCAACREIEASRSLDVLEVDGASNRGIDEIKAICENVRFAPASSRHKIYIIDEVHQVTDAGFNALLKTLEEPPAHVKFIFATTAAHKVPPTILSRCQRLDFRRIQTSGIAASLKEICKKEKIKADEDALFAIAKAADGSLRDSQSILDQIAASCPKGIDAQEVARLLGSPDEEKLVAITAAVAARDAAEAVLLFDRALSEGRDCLLFLEKMLEHVRNLLFVQASEKLTELIDAPESYKKALLSQKDLMSREELFYAFTLIGHALQTMKRFESKRVPAEVALIKLACRAPMTDLAKAIEELRSMPAPAAAPASLRIGPGAAPAASEPYTPLPPRRAARPREGQEDAGLDDADQEELPQGDIDLRVPAVEDTSREASLEELWQPLLRAIKQEKISVASYLAEGEPIGIQGGVAKVAFPLSMTFHKETLETSENRMLIERHLGQLAGAPLKVQFESVKQLRGGASALPEEASGGPLEAAADDEAVRSAMNIFGGKVIR